MISTATTAIILSYNIDTLRKRISLHQEQPQLLTHLYPFHTPFPNVNLSIYIFIIILNLVIRLPQKSVFIRVRGFDDFKYSRSFSTALSPKNTSCRHQQHGSTAATRCHPAACAHTTTTLTCHATSSCIRGASRLQERINCGSDFHCRLLGSNKHF